MAQFVGNLMLKNGNTYQLITDHLGSVRLVVNVSDGTIAQQLDYDEYGNITKNTNPDFQPFTYAGGLYDSQTRLVRFGARDYDASVGRWTCKDPIGFGGGVSNIYEYVINNPINYLDLSGKQEIQLSIGGGGTAFIIMGGLHIEVNIGLALNLSDFGQTRLYGQGEFAIMTGLGIAAIASGQVSGGGYKEP